MTSRSTSNCGDGFGAHAGAAIGVQGQGAGHDVLLVDGIGDQLLGELGGFPVSDHPADDVAAENIEDHVQVKARPLGRSLRISLISQLHTSFGRTASSSGLVYTG